MEAETARNLPAKLVSLRKQKGITQMELAEKLNVSRQAISRWEVGAAVPTTDNLKVLSELYSVSIDYLLNDAAESASKQNEEKCGIQSRTGFSVSAAIIAVLLAIILMLTAVVVSMAKNSDKKQNQVVSITDLTVVEGDDYPCVTFSFE